MELLSLDLRKSFQIRILILSWMSRITLYEPLREASLKQPSITTAGSEIQAQGFKYIQFKPKGALLYFFSPDFMQKSASQNLVLLTAQLELLDTK